MSAHANATQDTPIAASSVSAISAPAPTPDNPSPHIALLLPLKSKSAELARAADIVQKGFKAAAGIQQGIPVRVYASNDEAKEIFNLYRQALANGAMGVVGPLTRNGVAALDGFSTDLVVPTLALNTSEQTKNNRKLYFFGLPAENEARQIAQLANLAKMRNATLISINTTLSKRLAAAFAEEWKQLGGSITGEVVFNGDVEILADLPVAPWPEGTEPRPVPILSPSGEEVMPSRPLPPQTAPGNMIFLAVDHDKARLIRPYLNPSLPVYATSQLFIGNTNKLANFDLNEIRFVDMPWLLQPDHPAVMSYPRAVPALEPNLDRLYALGIDAYRLMHMMLANRLDSALPLDGVTGRIRLSNQQFLREPIPAFFKLGMGLTTDTLNALNAAKAALKVAPKPNENGSGLLPPPK